MPVAFAQSETSKNLMRAFAGESQARNRYTFSAGVAKKQSLHVVETVFKFTADQELAHAKVFYDFLKPMLGETIHVDGGYPVDQQEGVIELLRAAQHNEYEEHDDVYAHFADTAQEENFVEIANAFRMIAQIEKFHGDRFGQFADWMQQNTLFKETQETEWMCLNCGRIHKGVNAPEICPVCKHNQGYFIRLAYAPYQK